LQDPTLSDADRFNLVKLKTEAIEKKAQHEEKLLQARGDDEANVDRTIEVNDMYIESIKAKLKMLDKI